MWWKRLGIQADELRDLRSCVPFSATVASTATLVGGISIGDNTRVCPGAYVEGPVRIGADCLIGNNAMIRGPISIGDGTRIGFAAEIKNAVIGAGVAIGPLCYIADSVVEDEAYFGAMVRTSNHRLDRQPVKAMHEGVLHDTGLEKLGAYIGAGASLGIQVVILPGRIVAPGSVFGPHITIEKNLPLARYRLKQELLAADITHTEVMK
jgi:bifunctional UDP-N-acetylglucosamine pyrophosphorylase/glucosamine-1-phosphate N-acetyltransferase